MLFLDVRFIQFIVSSQDWKYYYLPLNKVANANFLLVVAMEYNWVVPPTFGHCLDGHRAVPTWDRWEALLAHD